MQALKEVKVARKLSRVTNGFIVGRIFRAREQNVFMPDGGLLMQYISLMTMTLSKWVCAAAVWPDGFWNYSDLSM